MKAGLCIAILSLVTSTHADPAPTIPPGPQWCNPEEPITERLSYDTYDGNDQEILLVAEHIGSYSNDDQYLDGRVIVHLDDALNLGHYFKSVILNSYKLSQDSLISNAFGNRFQKQMKRMDLNHTLVTFLDNVNREMSRVTELKNVTGFGLIEPKDPHERSWLTEEQLSYEGFEREDAKGLLTVDWQREGDRLDIISDQGKQLEANLKRFASPSVAEFSNTCEALYKLLKDYIDRLEDLVQTGMIQRLSTKYLTSNGIIRMYNDLNDKAIDLGKNLLIQKPTDLYQLDVTMKVESGGKISVSVHVPVVNPRTKADIYRMIDFPIDFGHPTHVAAVDFREKVFVVFSHPENSALDYTLVTTETELAKCKVFNEFYFCSQSALSSEDRLTRCFNGWLSQDESALKYCTYNFRRNGDTILRFDENTYIVFTKRQHYYVVNEYCQGTRTRSAQIDTGINRIVKCNGCYLDFLKFADADVISPKRPLSMTSFSVRNIFETNGLNVTRAQLDFAITVMEETGHEVFTQRDINLLMNVYSRFDILETKIQSKFARIPTQ